MTLSHTETHVTITYRNFEIEALSDPMGFAFTIVHGMGADGQRIFCDMSQAIEAVDMLLDGEP